MIFSKKIPFAIIDKLIHDYIEQEGFTCGLRDITVIVHSIMEQQARRIEPELKKADERECDGKWKEGNRALVEWSQWG